MKKLLSLAIVLTIVLAFAVPAVTAAPIGFFTGEITQIDKKGYDSFKGKEITANNSVTVFNNFKFVADNKSLNAWYIDVTGDINGTLEAAYKVSSSYYVVTFDIDGPGKYWIADSKGCCGANAAKIGEFAPHVHSYTAVVTPPGCKENFGYTTYTCECGDSYIGDIVPGLPHMDGPDPTVTKEPTCTEPGQTTWYCFRCGESNTVLAIPPALGHDYIAVVTAPTCTDEGHTTYTCSRCGDEYVDAIPATGHNYDNDKTNSAYYTLPTYEADGFWTFPCLNPGCDSTSVEQDAGSKLIHNHVHVTDFTITFTDTFRNHYFDDDGYEYYRWSGNANFYLTLSDGNSYSMTLSNYFGIGWNDKESWIPTDTNNAGPYTTAWSSSIRNMAGEIGICYDVSVRFSLGFTYLDGVTIANISNVSFENGADLVCGF